MITPIVIERDHFRGAVASYNNVAQLKGNPVRKTALGIVLALVLAAVPVALFSTTAVAGDAVALRVINGQYASQQTIDVYANGVEVVTALPISTAADITLPAGSTNISVCKSASAGVNGSGVCQNKPSPAQPTAQVGPTISTYVLVSGDNDVLTIGGGGPPQLDFNDLASTGLGEFRYTLHNATFVGTPLDVCIGGVKVVTGLAVGASITVDLTAQQGAPYAVFTSAAGCGSPSANVNFVAGTNFVQTALASNPSSAAGNQVLLVGEGTVPNNPDTAAFCKAIIGLAGVQPALKTLVGNVDPTSTQTIINTQPSVADMQAFYNDTLASLQAGDSTVPATIQPSWATSTAGLRKLLQTFQLAGYQLSNLPVDAVHEIVEGANGFKLPGVPPDQDVAAATAALTAFYSDTCVAAATPVTPTPATPVPAAAHFTG